MHHDETYYRILLPDFSAPFHCPRVKPYYGTLDEIEAVLKVAEKIPCFKQLLESTLDAFWEFLHGYEDAVHVLYGDSYPVLTPAECLEYRITEVNHHTWQHTDFAGKQYRLEADHGVLEEAVFREDELYIRCVRARLRNVQFFRNGEKELVFGGYRGFPGIFECHDTAKELQMRLFVEESFFFFEEDALQNMHDEKRINYYNISKELLGDVRTY